VEGIGWELLAWESLHQVNFALALHAVIATHNDFFEEPPCFLQFHIQHTPAANGNTCKSFVVVGAKVFRLPHLDNDELSLFHHQMDDCKEREKAKLGNFYPVYLTLDSSVDDWLVPRWISVRLLHDISQIWHKEQPERWFEYTHILTGRGLVLELSTTTQPSYEVFKMTKEGKHWVRKSINKQTVNT
jgi:hypothetical protein